MGDSAPTSPTEQHRTPLWVWFVAAGLLELAIALIAALVFRAPASVFRVLLPTIMFFGVDPSTPSFTTQIIQGVILFGGSFLIYGTIGLVAGTVTRLLRSTSI
jgi:hypothetical protein